MAETVSDKDSVIDLKQNYINVKNGKKICEQVGPHEQLFTHSFLRQIEQKIYSLSVNEIRNHILSKEHDQRYKF